MKLVFGLALLLLAVIAVKAGYSRCPEPKEGCMYTMDLNPVCSTQGCTYMNFGQMKCARGRFWYQGECKNKKPGTG